LALGIWEWTDSLNETGESGQVWKLKYLPKVVAALDIPPEVAM
jgi:hypothetical protein